MIRNWYENKNKKCSFSELIFSGKKVSFITAFYTNKYNRQAHIDNNERNIKKDIEFIEKI